MTDEREYFERLSRILRQYGFDWVLTQVQAEISEGRAVSKEVSAPSIGSEIDPITAARQTPRRSRASLVTTEPLTPREQLEVLIRGIETAIILRADLEKSVFGMTSDINVINFKPDKLEEEFFLEDRPSHILKRDQIGAADQVKEEVGSALKKLRTLLDAST